MAPANWIARTFAVAPLVVTQPDPKGSDGEREIVQDHELPALIERPNPFYDSFTLWAATLVAWCTTGNAYWIKVRSGSRKVVELWWAPNWTMQPRWNYGGTEFVTHYDYSPSGYPIRLEPDDVVHLRHGIDPENVRQGRAPIREILREVFTDDEASRYTAAILRNLGVPGIVVSPDGEQNAGISEADARAIKEKMDERLTGENRGKATVLTGKTKVTQFGFSPKDMDVSNLRDVSEERVCAAFGIPAAVVGFGSGLQTTKVGAPQPLSARLWTPAGPTTMGEVKIGQTIAIPNGWGKVQAVYPQGEQDIYRITFQDGSTAESTQDHLWDVQLPYRNDRSILPLSAIAGLPEFQLKRAAVPLQGVTEFEEQQTLIPPYVMGLLLADGSFRSNLFFSNADAEIVDTVRRAVGSDYDLVATSAIDHRLSYRHLTGGRGPGNRSPFKEELRRLGLWMLYSHEKFVPDLYKYNSSEARRELLRGLLDGDGYVNLHGQPALEQTSARLAADVTFLVQSLGGYTLPVAKRADRSLRFIKGHAFHSRHDRVHQSIVIENGPDLLLCSAKQSRCRPRGKLATRKFRKIEFARREQAQCIAVDGSLYLTDNFIVTHNTMREMVALAWDGCLIPYQRIISSQIGHSLLPDFDTNKQRRVSFDRSGISALQEDQTALSTRLSQQLTAGGILRAEYRRRLGYDPDPGGADDVYLMPISVIEVRPGETMLPAPAVIPPALPPPKGKGRVVPLLPLPRRDGQAFMAERVPRGEKRARGTVAQRRLVFRLARGARALEAPFAIELHGFFRELGAAAAAAAQKVLRRGPGAALRRAAARARVKDVTPGPGGEPAVTPPVTIDELLQLAEVQDMITEMGITAAFQRLQAIYGGHYLRTATETMGAINETMGLGVALPDPLAREIVAAGGRRVGLVDLTQQTRDNLFEALTEGRTAGEGVDDLVARIRDEVPAGPWSDSETRARVIARTETAHAQRSSSLALYREAENVDQVMLMDDRLGYGDDDCSARNGQVVSFEEAEQAMEDEHPQGTLQMVPIVGDSQRLAAEASAALDAEGE